jgi:assimilatory nitrate reductase catalytic subunit
MAWHDSRSPPDHGSGFEAYLLAGEEPIAAARQKLSAALRARNPGPWLEGESGVSAVIGDGVLEAVMSLSEARDETARDRLTPFMSMGRLGVEQRNALLQGGDAADRGGEICACFGISTRAVTAAIAGGATSLDTIGAATRAGSNCGSCRPELRALVRATRAKQAA